MAKADEISSFGKYREAEFKVSKITEDELKTDDELKIVVASRVGHPSNETTGRSPIK